VYWRLRRIPDNLPGVPSPRIQQPNPVQSCRHVMERKHNPTKSASNRSQFESPHLTPPSRITTAPTSEKSGYQFHHHPRRYRHQRDKSQPQSAVQLQAPGGLFADNVFSKVLSRSNGATPPQSTAGSRRESVIAGKEELKEGPSQGDVDKANEQRRTRNE
jgi:hypothetical protein